MTTLPIEIITEILSRLPVESLLEFKCVSKSWYTLIKSPNFIKLHLNQTLISNSNRNLLLSYSSDHSSDINFHHNHLVYSDIDLNHNHLLFSELDHPLKHREINFVGSCNGIVCISDKSKNDIFLFNPVTKSRRKLPPNHTHNPGNDKTLVFGFGFDSENDDYKVLRLIQDSHYSEVHHSKAEVYSLRENSWRCVEGIPYFLLFVYRHGVFVNEAMHYIVVTKELQMQCKFIASFDFKTENYSIMDCPDYDDKLGGSLDLGELGGCLCLLVMYRTLVPASPLEDPYDRIDFRMNRADLWVMKEYGKKESWVRLFSIPQTASVGMYLQIRTIVYSKDRRRILLEYNSLGLGWYDLETQSFSQFKGLPQAPISSGFFVSSLVSLEINKQKSDCGTRLSMPRKNTKNKQLDDFLSTGFKLKL
ncbi:F-box protein CPR30-like [Chenopodium quinoa]|uniref:F-box protein CPR30-like n=1 Tax=Chenopodium quinoa TaxID=63459 RepID=UPI000B789F4F|nr:F-box protein CPR30-like [Chenopodium quinoa]